MIFTKSVKKIIHQRIEPTCFMSCVALAEILDYPKDIIDTPEKVEGFFQSASDWIFTIFLIVAVIGIIYVAFMYLTAAGNPTKVTKARQALTYSITAIIIALLAGSMPTLLRNVLDSSSSDIGDVTNNEQESASESAQQESAPAQQPAPEPSYTPNQSPPPPPPPPPDNWLDNLVDNIDDFFSWFDFGDDSSDETIPDEDLID